jgi:hypothetical protein
MTFPPLAIGTVVEAVGITLLAAALSWAHLPTIYGMLALTGVGTGIRLMPGTYTKGQKVNSKRRGRRVEPYIDMFDLLFPTRPV